MKNLLNNFINSATKLVDFHGETYRVLVNTDLSHFKSLTFEEKLQLLAWANEHKDEPVKSIYHPIIQDALINRVYNCAPLPVTEENRKALASAFRSSGFPCNPIPFLNGLAEGVRENGTDYIKSDEAKKMLLVIIQQSYGQAASVDTYEEFVRLLSV